MLWRLLVGQKGVNEEIGGKIDQGKGLNLQEKLRGEISETERGKF